MYRKKIQYMIGYGASNITIQKTIPSAGLRLIKTIRKQMQQERQYLKTITFGMRYGKSVYAQRAFESLLNIQRRT
jgi:hypothetical protein